MKQVLFVILTLCTPSIHAQKFLNPIAIGLREPIKFSGIKNSYDLSDKISKAISKAMDSLSQKYEFEFIDIPKEPERHVDLIVDIRLGYNDRTSVSYGNLFKYKSEVTFKDFKTDSVVGKVELIYKDLENTPVLTMMADDYKTYDKVFSKIAVPVHVLLNPTALTAKENCFCFKIENVIDPKTTVATNFTHILNNALVYHQKQYMFQYYDMYKAQNKNNKMPRVCNLIIGSLETIQGQHVLKIKYGNDSVNLTHPRQVKTEFYFDNKRIAEGDYYEAIWQINKSIYSFLENNVTSR